MSSQKKTFPKENFLKYFSNEGIDGSVLKDFGFMTPEAYEIFVSISNQMQDKSPQEDIKIPYALFPDDRLIVPSVFLRLTGHSEDFDCFAFSHIMNLLSMPLRAKAIEQDGFNQKGIETNGFEEIRKRTSAPFLIDDQIVTFASLIAQTRTDLRNDLKNQDTPLRESKREHLEQLDASFKPLMGGMAEYMCISSFSAVSEIKAGLENSHFSASVNRVLQYMLYHFKMHRKPLNFEEVDRRILNLMQLADRAIVWNPVWSVKDKVALFDAFPKIQERVEHRSPTVINARAQIAKIYEDRGRRNRQRD